MKMKPPKAVGIAVNPEKLGARDSLRELLGILSDRQIAVRLEPDAAKLAGDDNRFLAGGKTRRQDHHHADDSGSTFTNIHFSPHDIRYLTI